MVSSCFWSRHCGQRYQVQCVLRPGQRYFSESWSLKSFSSRKNSTFWLPNRRNVLRISNKDRSDFPIKIICKVSKIFQIFPSISLCPWKILFINKSQHSHIFPWNLSFSQTQIYHFLRIFPIQISLFFPRDFSQHRLANTQESSWKPFTWDRRPGFEQQKLRHHGLS